MKKEEKKVLLTSNLYMEIAADKNEEIVGLKDDKVATKEALAENQEELKKLQEEQAKILKKIKETRTKISELKALKFHLTLQLSKQKRLANKLNKEVTKDEPYIYINKFYTKQETKKR